MRGSRSEVDALSKLLKIARQRCDEVGARIADAETAHASAQTQLDWFDSAIKSEETQIDVNFADLARYLGRASEKRIVLNETVETLQAEIDALRAELRKAFVEQRKLEHLLDLSRGVQKKKAMRKLVAFENDAARAKLGS